MNGEAAGKAWQVWIDDKKRIISAREEENARLLCYTNRESGVAAVSRLVYRGYRVK